jgi:hypothetical protein
MSAQVVPLTSDPNQTLRTTVTVDGTARNLQLKISYNESASYWVMDVTDPATGTILLSGIPLITGEYPSANVLGQYGYLGIGSAYVVPVGSVAMDWPDAGNLGTEFVLVWGDA